MTSVHNVPRSILLPSPTRPSFHEPDRPRTSFNESDSRARTSITIDDRPRIVSRPLVEGRRDRRRSSASQEETGAERKGGVFGGLFSGRKKKIGKEDVGVPMGISARQSMSRAVGKEGMMESLEGEVIHAQLKPVLPTPVRRASESDMPAREATRPRPPLLSLNTTPVVPPSSAGARPSPRRRSSTRLVSPSTSSRPTSPTSPSLMLPSAGFTPFYHSGRTYNPPPMSAPASSSSFRASQMPQRSVEIPFSLTIRHQERDPRDDMYDVQESVQTVQTAFDPAQFEDGSDTEQWPLKPSQPETTMVPLIGISTPPMTASPQNEWTTPTLDVTFVSHDFTAAPEMQRSDSGPPPTFKVIPATPIAPAENSPQEKQAAAVEAVMVPVNPVRPRKLALMLDAAGPSRVPSDASSPESASPRVDPLGFESAFQSSGSEGSSPLEFTPSVRSPSVESLQRNTEPLRLAHSPRLVSPKEICHPVTSSLGMTSPYQSSRALAESTTSSTMATTTTTTTSSTSFDSLDTMDLEDVESALGTMLASLSTRPSLASRLTLDDPGITYRAEMGLSALGFGVGQDQTQPKGRDYFPSLDSYSGAEPFNVLYSDVSPRGERESTYTSDDEAQDSDSICSDIDDLGSVSIAVVQKGSPGVFASPRTLSIGDGGVERLQ